MVEHADANPSTPASRARRAAFAPQTDRTRAMAVIEASVAVLVWGASFIATKLALREVSPITVIWLRFGMGVLVLGIAVVARRQLAWVRARELGYLGLLGFLGVALHQWLQSNGLVTSQATTLDTGYHN